MARTIKKFFKNTGKKKIRCTGCGRHEKEVPQETNWYFCSHCVSNNNNYGRFKAGLPLIKPIDNLKIGDIILDSYGKPHEIIRKSRSIGEDTWYFCKQMFGKEQEVELGDFEFYKKTGKREVNKINKTMDAGGNSLDFVTNYSEKSSCLNCKFADKILARCNKKDISLLNDNCNVNDCEFYKAIKIIK